MFRGVWRYQPIQLSVADYATTPGEIIATHFPTVTLEMQDSDPGTTLSYAF